MSERFDLIGKTAIVTGAGSGIGEAIALVLAQQAALVNILEIDDQKDMQVAEAINITPPLVSPLLVYKALSGLKLRKSSH